MREQASVGTDLMDHAAVRAWSELRQARVVPERIEVLKSRTKSSVYRLCSVGPGGSHVVGKRCTKTNALAERFINEEVLPHFPFTTLGYYGLVEEPDTEFCWVFIEDAKGVPYSPDVEEHRVLASEWLSVLHTT